MTLSAKRASTSALVLFCRYADANGFRLLEMPPYDAVQPIHIRDSWHYYKDGRYGQAVDINYGPPGASREERAMLRRLIPVAQSFGLAVIFDTTGHYSHMHVDVGSRANIGGGWFTPHAGTTKTYRIQEATHIVAHKRDNLYGPMSDRRVDAVRNASKHHGVKFPHGVHEAQRAVGTEVDGKWGPDSRAAHDLAVARLQRIWGLEDDGIWGRKTEAAYKAHRKTYGRGL